MCYMGIADPTFSRSAIYMKGLRDAGVTVYECFDTSPGLTKFARLWQRYRAVPEHDVVIVGYPSYIAVPFARLIARVPVIFDAGWSLYEGEVISRGRHAHNPFGRFGIWLIDWCAYQAARVVLLETRAQIRFYVSLVRGREGKLRRLYTGTDEDKFYPVPAVPHEVFTVLFRGKYNPEAGIETVVAAARLLEAEDIRVHIMSPGYSPKAALPHNVTVDHIYYSQDEIRAQMAACDLALGQLAAHPRLARTIPHKAFETTAMGLPYVTARSEGVLELFTEGESVYAVTPGDAEDLARAVRTLKSDGALRARIAEGGRRAYTTHAAQSLLAQELITIIKEQL